MYNASEDYKNAITKNVRTPKNKVVVDGVEYTGRLDLLTYPKLTQEATMMIGGFPAKTVEFELYNKDDNINLLNKDVEVYRGYEVGKKVFASDTSRITNVAIDGLDFSKGFSIKLRGFFDASKHTTNYSRMFASTRDTSLITRIGNPNSLVLYASGVSSTEEPIVNLSKFTKDELLTITVTYDLATIRLTATNGVTTVTSNVARSVLNFGAQFFIGSQDLTGNPIFEYDSVEIETYVDSKVYKYVVDETQKWKSVGAVAPYTINGKWDIKENTEYVPMGIYRARAEEDVTNNSTNKKIVFKGTDRAVEFNKIHSTANDPTFPCTYLEYLKSIIASYGYELESEDFPFASTTMNQAPNITNNTTDRELISRFAEMCGGIAQMSRTGKVLISTPYKTNTKIPKTYYSTLSSKEKKHGCISTLVLGRDDGSETVFDDITKTDTNIQNQAYGRNQLALTKCTQAFSYITVNSVEDNKLIITSSNNAGQWQSVRFFLPAQSLQAGIYTIHSKTLATNNTSAAKTYICIDEHETANNEVRVRRWEFDSARRDNIQFEVKDGYYYSIIFYASTTEVIVGTNTVTYDELYIAKEDEFSKYEPYQANGISIWRIDNNPFLDLIRESMIDAVAKNILGQSVTPFQLDECVDDFFYDLNDIIEVQDKMGSWFETRVLSISSTGRIRTSYGAFTQEEETSYNLVGSTSDAGKTVKLDVDRITGQINTINQTLDGYGTQFTQTEQNFQFLFNENNQQKDYINFEDGTIIIGKVGNEYKLVQYNDRIIFLQNQQETAKLIYNLFFAEDIQAGKSLQVGEYILETDEDDGLDLDWGGE